MELKFFGRGAGFYPVEGNTNAWLEVNDNLILLDCGESTYAKLFQNPGLSQWKTVVVLLTHLHADHVGSLASLCSYNYFVLKRKVYVVYPVDTVKELLRLEGIEEYVYHYAKTMPLDIGVDAKAIPVKHVSDMQCFAYELSDKNETIYYSGDSAEFPDMIVEKLQNGEYRRVYHDIASYPSDTHCPISVVEDKVPFGYRKYIFAMHLDGDVEERFISKGFSVVKVATP